MKRRRWLILLVLAAVPLALWRNPVASSGAGGPGVAPAPRSQNLMGAGSCAAAACHNGNFVNGQTGSEYTHWITRDRDHAQAYEVLFDELARNIQKALHRMVDAHNDQRCLACHTSPDFDLANPPTHAPYFKTDGVSCESCHGPAKNWLNVHHLDAWQSKTATEKKALGMNDTRSLLGRAQVCAKCHVGAPGMEVDHDLIAAGHPRLHFELAAFSAHLPRHWSDTKDRAGRPDFEARAWAIGQFVTARSALELLADHAQDKDKVWPEFALFDCAVCHHDLQFPSPRQQEGFSARKPGLFPWGYQVAMARRILETGRGEDAQRTLQQLDQMRKIMDTGNPNRQTVALQAKAATALLPHWRNELNNQPLDRKSVEMLMRSLLATITVQSGDELTQTRLGLIALYNAQSDQHVPIPADLQDSLLRVFKNRQSVKHFDPEAIRKRQLEFNKLGQQGR